MQKFYWYFDDSKIIFFWINQENEKSKIKIHVSWQIYLKTSHLSRIIGDNGTQQKQAMKLFEQRIFAAPKDAPYRAASCLRSILWYIVYYCEPSSIGRIIRDSKGFLFVFEIATPDIWILSNCISSEII